MRHLLTLAALFPAMPALAQEMQALEIPHEKHVLDNGLEVVLHQDHSDPVVAVYVYYHVGSSREELGRSGFAHLFEHMLFQGSQHVGDDQHFKLIQEAGGSLNGTTNQDRTNYFETLPSNQLELALWLESDRMGFLLPSMTQEKLDNQRDVVKNERRQRYENRPYGLVHESVLRNLYPEGHPYSWTTIGSMDDLSAATLEDVSNFFRRWYGPNNATLVVAGDIDPAEALRLVERYFGSIPRGPAVDDPRPEPVTLTDSRRIVLEDRVELPQLTLVWPTVPAWHADDAALNLLADVLSANRSSVLDKVLLIEEELANYVTISHSSQERAGALTINVRPNPGVSLDQLERRVDELIAELASEGVDAARLERLKNRREGSVVRGLETVSARASRLANDNCFHGDPSRVTEDLARHRAVTAEEVAAAAKEYLVGRHRVVVSTVPEGALDLAASGRTEDQATREHDLDRTVQPTSGPTPAFAAPEVWHAELANGVPVTGTAYSKIPLTRLSLAVPAGRLQETSDQLGLASLTAEMLEEGTRRLSGTELTDELDGMGATLSVGSSDDEMVINLSVLNQHLPRVVLLLEELLLEPRFDEADFERVRRLRLVDLETRKDDARALASDAYAALVWGAESIKGAPRLGTPATVAGLDVEDVRRFWTGHASPTGARLSFVGAADAAEVLDLFGSLAGRWSAAAGEAVAVADARTEEVRVSLPAGVTIYLLDKPGAEQSELRIGHPGVSRRDELYYALQAMNYILGGSFSSRINMNLREDKGYTYGARSAFGGGLTPGEFTVSSGVQTPSTAPAVAEVLKELEGIVEGIEEAEVDFARQSLSQALARTYESTRARLSFVESIGKYGYPDDYPLRRLEFLRGMDSEGLLALARGHVHPESLVVLVVGDKERVLEGLEGLELGEVVEIGPVGSDL